MIGDLDFVIPTLQWWHQIVIILGVSLLLAEGIKISGSWIIRRSDEMADTTFGQILIEEIYAPLYRSFVLVGIYTSAQLLATSWLIFILSGASISGIVFLWSWAAARFGTRLLNVYNNGSRSGDFSPVLVITWKLCVFMAAFFVILSTWEIDITPLLASAGVIGIIVGIAAQGTISNLFAGISLNIDQTYKVGDIISLDSGERGAVVEVSMRSTTLLTRDNITITIPNSVLNEQQVINESAPRRPRRIRLPLGVAYSSDLVHVESILLEIGDEIEYVLQDPRPSVQYRAFGDSAIELEYLCHIRNPALRGRTIDALIREIHIQFDEEDIIVPFPQREISYLEDDQSETTDVSEKPRASSNTYEKYPSE